MSALPKVTLHHAPQTRSHGVLALLEELGVPYDLHVLNMKAGEHRQAAYLAVNPMGKVPAVSHLGEIITEQVALYIYLADLYPQAGLAPAVGDPLRGPFLRWIAFYGSCYEPAIIDRSMKREAAAKSTSPYGDFDDMWSALTTQLAKGPYLLGDHFSAADALWASALRWTTMFGLVPETPVTRAYMDRVSARPAFQRAAAIDADLVAKQSAPT